MKYWLNIFSFLFVILFMVCSRNQMFRIPLPIPSDQRNVPQPEYRKIHTYGEYFDKQIILQLDESFDVARQFRNISGTRKEAQNINSFGEVPNSSWFTNRNGRKQLTLKEITRGPNSGNGPDTSGAWVVTRAKAEGVTPGFSIRDKKGVHYVIKFDPIGFAELASGAEVISTKLFYAMGYNTPENYIVYFDPRILKLGEKVNFTDKKGHKRFMNQEDLRKILQDIQKLPDGKIRALASKYLEGVPLGPYKYEGIRKDDLNDFIPHQHRRELRGLRIIAAWLNHFDTKDGNSLDMYVTENGRSYVKHYLIDFGATLGSASHGPNHPWRGFQYDTDPTVITENIFTLGLYVKPWEKISEIKYTSIGRYEADLFNPIEYKGQVPNPAFENMTLNDGYWAAKIVTSFTDKQLQEVVKQGKYSAPAAEKYLLQTIIKRRDKIGRYFFSRSNPLDKFKLKMNKGREQELHFMDMAIERGYELAENTLYRYKIKTLPDMKTSFDFQEFEGQKFISLKEMREWLQKRLSGVKNLTLQIEIEIQARRTSENKWSKSVKVYLHPNLETGEFSLLGIIRNE